MKEEYVTYEQAVKLKKLGFDWNVSQYYAIDDNKEHKLCREPIIGGGTDNYNNYDGDTSAPELHIAQKWIREQCGWHICIDAEFDKTWFYGLVPIGGPTEDGGNEFDSYESALRAGIDDVLQMLIKWDDR